MIYIGVFENVLRVYIFISRASPPTPQRRSPSDPEPIGSGAARRGSCVGNDTFSSASDHPTPEAGRAAGEPPPGTAPSADAPSAFTPSAFTPAADAPASLGSLPLALLSLREQLQVQNRVVHLTNIAIARRFEVGRRKRTGKEDGLSISKFRHTHNYAQRVVIAYSFSKKTPESIEPECIEHMK